MKMRWGEKARPEYKHALDAIKIENQWRLEQEWKEVCEAYSVHHHSPENNEHYLSELCDVAVVALRLIDQGMEGA